MGRFVRLGHFHLANGAVSLGGNIGLMFVLHTVGGMPLLAANLLAIGACSLVNFFASDRLVFRAGAAAAALVLAASGPASAQPAPATLAAWEAYVKKAEARIERELQSSDKFLVGDLQGSSERQRILAGQSVVASGAQSSGLEIPDGRIHHWRGALLIRGITLDALLAKLQYPTGKGPFPSDVVTMRVIDRRGPDDLNVFMKLSRSFIVTVNYNTEHAVRYRRHSPQRASSRSVSTKIAELDVKDGREREKAPDEDRGYLWRLNSYWRYEEVPEGVIVECESLSLSRSAPLVVRVVAGSLINKVARESMERTLLSLRTLYGRAPA
jgi:hypothetical protein